MYVWILTSKYYCTNIIMKIWFITYCGTIMVMMMSISLIMFICQFFKYLYFNFFLFLFLEIIDM
jgi:hypothetical protein